MKLTIEICDYSNPDHLEAFASLLQGYMADPMGEHAAHSKLEQLRLVDGMASHPASFVVLASSEGQAIGFATCFELFSTFQVKPFVNIHDVFVSPAYRGHDIGRAILNYIAEVARQKRCCKVTLEVRTDNPVAQGLYRSEGYEECQPNMLFWTKKL